MRGAGRAVLVLTLGSGLAGAAEARAPCFDLATAPIEPLRPPIPLIQGRDNSVFGNRPDGVSWASTRARMGMPLRDLYARVLDHRNHKDMRKTVLSVSRQERPGYLDFQRVDVVVTVRALLVRVKLAWTEEWGFALAEGTREEPRRIVASYQKLPGGTKHMRHQCGSYVLQATHDGLSDLSMYDEVIADRRDGEDTRRMQAGILANLRQAR